MANRKFADAALAVPESEMLLFVVLDLLSSSTVLHFQAVMYPYFLLEQRVKVWKHYS